MSKVKMPEPIGYFACNPETLKPMWDEGCVCEDNIYNQDDMETVGRAIIFADQAEAYAAAKVREALDRYERDLRSGLLGLLEFDRDSVDLAITDVGRGIRALIPKQ